MEKKLTKCSEEEINDYRSKCLNLRFAFEGLVDIAPHLTGLEKAREKYKFLQVLNRIAQKPDGTRILFRG